MNLFVLKITYLKPFEEIEKVLAEHRSFLDTYYSNNTLFASGPQNPKVGGLIIGRFHTKEDALNFSKQDPFTIKELASYEITEFEPVKQSKFATEFLAI